jgi:diguanylate cyclase (GGDEF)-like protein
MINRNALDYVKIDSEFLSNTDSGVTFSKGDYYYWIATINEDLYFTSVKKGENLLKPLNSISMHILATTILVYVVLVLLVLFYVVRFARKEMKILEIDQGIFKKAVTEAKVDYLTKIGNRRSAEEALNNYFKIFQKDYSVFPIILFDIDNFKYINDTYGHFAGDKVIISIVDEVINCIEEKATLYRWGGDEFILIANNLAEEQADPFAKEILNVIGKMVIEVGEYKIKPTISMGISIFCTEDQYYLDVVERADQAMYQAKSSMGNRFQFIQKIGSANT